MDNLGWLEMRAKFAREALHDARRAGGLTGPELSALERDAAGCAQAFAAAFFAAVDPARDRLYSRPHVSSSADS